MKKLLIIGSSSTEVAIVKAAKELGLYTICCDGITDASKIPAKDDADEVWNINYSNIDEIASMCIANHVDGVMAGYSEWRVLAASKIAKAIGKPFYATEEQIELTRDKRKFKDMCKKFDVPVPKDYCLNLPLSKEEIDAIQYPVIVKPVDNGGRKGITVCHNTEDLNNALDYALNNSVCKQIVIEDFIEGIEVTAIYTIKNGDISLSLMKDKYQTTEYSQLCNCTLTPSVFASKYIATVDMKVRNFLKGISANNGVCFFQMIATDKDIRIFEMGYRLNGGNDYKIISRINGENYMNMLINYSIYGSMDCATCREVQKFDMRDSDNYNKGNIFCEYLIHCHAGVLGKIDFSKLHNIVGVDEAYSLKRKGMVISENGTTEHTCGRIVMHGNSLQEIHQLENIIYEEVIVEDINGKDLRFLPFDFLSIQGR